MVKAITILIIVSAFSVTVHAGQISWPVSCIPGVTCNRENFSIGFPDLDGDTKAFDCRKAGYKGHTGTDVFVSEADKGVDVVAAEAGEVVWVQDGKFDRCPDPNESDCKPGIKKICSLPADATGKVFNINCSKGSCDCLWGFNPGNFVLVKHDTGSDVALTVYAHLKKRSIGVKTGQQVAKGEKLGEVGSSGNALRPHLHFGVWARGNGSVDLIDPWAGSCGTNDSNPLWEYLPPYRADLLVERKGRGSGEIRASSAAMDCANECTGSFIPGTSVTLTAVPKPGSSFAGWDGDCASTSSTCTFTITGNSKVKAVFHDVQPPQIVSFLVPAVTPVLTVPVSSFRAVDNVGVSSYLITESQEKPSLADSGWSNDIPRQFTLSASGLKTLYAWVRDRSGNISSYAKAVVSCSAPSAEVRKSAKAEPVKTSSDSTM